MANIDLDKLTYEELTKLEKDVAKTKANYKKRRRQEALAAAEAKAKEMGFSLSELMGAQPKKPSKRNVNPPKYRHPDDPSLTWTGRGRQPAWIKDALEAGKSLDSFLIK